MVKSKTTPIIFSDVLCPAACTLTLHTVPALHTFHHCQTLDPKLFSQQHSSRS
jgi:hypothetical protein